MSDLHKEADNGDKASLQIVCLQFVSERSHGYCNLTIYCNVNTVNNCKSTIHIVILFVYN